MVKWQVHTFTPTAGWTEIDAANQADADEIRDALRAEGIAAKTVKVDEPRRRRPGDPGYGY